jgi:digeranylgeranylglycerophospholipid reductase
VTLRKSYQAIVVGAGPGGSTAAYYLAREGVDVLLLEREREIGKNIICAEGISKRALEILDIPKGRFIASMIKRTRIYGPSGNFLEIETPEVGYILERKIFDRFLAERAAKSGAEVLSGAQFVSVKRGNGRFSVGIFHRGKLKEVETYLIVGADGAVSNVGKLCGLRVDLDEEDAHFCAQYYISHPEIEGDTVSFYAGSKWAPGGYAWVFPKGDGVANVGVGIRKNAGDARGYLDHFVESHFPNAKLLGEVKGIVPIGGHRMEIVGDGVMLVGDAARLADPLSGGGIANAMLSGKIAGEVGSELIKRGELSKRALSLYPEKYWGENLREYELSYRVMKFYRSLEDDDMDFLVGEIKRILDGKSIEEVDTFVIARRIFSSPKIWGFIAKRGKDAFLNYLRETVFKRR